MFCFTEIYSYMILTSLFQIHYCKILLHLLWLCHSVRGFSITSKLFGEHKKLLRVLTKGKGFHKELCTLYSTDTYKLLITLFKTLFSFSCLSNGWQSRDKSGTVHFLLILLLLPIASDFCIIKACVFSINCFTERLLLSVLLPLTAKKLLLLGLD